ncbi:MAG: type VI secretion system Vgr family protein [Mariniblastus sp.]
MIQLNQENRQARIDTPLGEDVLLLQYFSGTESISRDFAYEATVVSKDPAIDGQKIVGKQISITYFDEDGRERHFNGYVSRFEYSDQVEEPTKLTCYNLTLVPWLWFLKHNQDCQIFQEMAAPDIIKQIFQELGFNDFQMKLTEDYAVREFCVQYRETDFNFVSRLMEEEGIFYYFEHSKDKHIMVLADSPSGYFELNEPEVKYKPIGQKQFQQLHGWRHVFEFRPGKMAQKDFNFKVPTDPLLTDKKSAVKFEGSSNFEVFEYPGRYDESPEGDRLTKVRVQEIEAEHNHVVGSGMYLKFTPGGTFSIADHSNPAEIGKAYALVEVFTEFNSNFGFGNEELVDFRNEFRCIPAETTYRPRRVTKKPFVEGPQTAIVTTDGQEIVVDEHARVKVQFHWDRYGTKDINSSCWIRVSSAHAGQGWGCIDHPRQDEEVIVSFLDGDPDRPIITGRVYNGDNPVPFPLKGAGENSKNKKRRGNTTKSYEAEGYNELTMDDTAGEEQIRIHAQHNLDTVIEHDETWTVHHDRTKVVDNIEDNTIGVDQNSRVGNNRTMQVGVNHDEVIGNNQSIQIGVQKDEVIGDVANENVGRLKTITVGEEMNVQIGFKSTEQIGVEKIVTVGENYELVAGKKVHITCGGSSVTLESNGDVTISGKEFFFEASGKVNMKGSKIHLN